MRFFCWLGRNHQPARSFRPGLDLLEDRTVPAVLRVFGPVVPPATHLQVIVPSDVVTGQAFNVVVEALDKTNHIATGYTGTVKLKLGTADAGATIPASFTFSAADHGKHTIQVKLVKIGDQTVNATSGALTGQGDVTVDAPATHFSVSIFGHVSAGAPTLVNVVALDANNQTVMGYTGTVHFTSTDPLALLPANYAFTMADGGSHLFAVTFGWTGTCNIAVMDAAHHSINGGASAQVHPYWWYYPVYATGYPASNVVTNPVTTGFASLPIAGGSSTLPGASGLPSFASSNVAAGPLVTGIPDPIGNISYNQNPFGSAKYFANDPIANISYGLNPFGTATTNVFGNLPPNAIAGNNGNAGIPWWQG